MKKIRLLKLFFDSPIAFTEVPYFRAAIIDELNKQGFGGTTHHNHQRDGKSIYTYPLVQYKKINGKAAILFLENSIDYFMRSPLNQPSYTLRIGTREQHFNLEHTRLESFEMKVDKSCINIYKISKWIALNKRNYDNFKQLICQADRLNELKRILSSNILSILKDKSIGFRPDERFSVYMIDPNPKIDIEYLKNKAVPMTSFTLKFASDILLPDYIGLGKSAARGFGMIKHIGTKQALKLNSI